MVNYLSEEYEIFKLMFEVDTFKRTYPEMFSSTTVYDMVLGIILLSILFILPYLYVRFLEDRLLSFVVNWLIPFIEFRMRLKKLIDLIYRVLEIRIFGNNGSRI